MFCAFLKKRKRRKWPPPRWLWPQLQREKDESFYALLEEMEVGVFRSCFKRSKSVILEGLVTRFDYGVGGERKKKKKKMMRAY